MRRALLPTVLSLVAFVPGAPAGERVMASAERVEVVVTLPAPSLARAQRPTRAAGLTVSSTSGRAYLRGLDAAQDRVAARIEAEIPSARIRWRYRITLDGLAVVLPRRELPRLARVAGVDRVWPRALYRVALDRSPGLIGAPTIWGPTLSSAGQGVKIGIVDDGVDQTHPFFDPAGFSYPPGFPKGQRAYTTPKVIVARAFPQPVLTPATPRSKYDAVPFDPQNSFHGTHVAGIAAGDNGVRATVGGRTRILSGVAPKAYLGNYKAIGVPTASNGLVDNAAELVAAIEAAAADGMDVINLSLGEAEIEPSRNVVVRAIDGAAAAGVVPVIAAGNEFEELGAGSIGSPGSADAAITVGAVSKSLVVSPFSSGGPTPVSLRLKPDVAAPGEGILSSVPRSQGTWDSFQGTSMASPHVAGAAALLRQRHPTWTVAQLKSALVQTGAPVFEDGSRRVEASALREGGGLVDLPKADVPQLFADPVSVSFGLLRLGQTVSRAVTLTDAGGGAGAWVVSLVQQQAHPDVKLSAPASVDVPGTITVIATAGGTADGRDLAGFVVLRRGTETRRIPYWVSVSAAALASEPRRTLTRTGLYRGDTRGKPSLVATYRYPRAGSRLPGPEQVFRFTLSRPVANFGAIVLAGPRGLEPRIVVAGDESRLLGLSALPVDLNPYTRRYGASIPVVAAIRPRPGAYDVVFDTSGATGPYTFRFWVDDSAPPRLRLLTTDVTRGGTLVLSASDPGAGVDPASIEIRIDGRPRPATYRGGRIRVRLGRLAGGRHTLVALASDFQETKNGENVPLVLPNTAVLRRTVVVG